MSFKNPPHMIVDISMEFLGHLRHFPGTLKQCSLVCKSWLYPSQKQLFAKLRSQNRGPKRDFQHLLQFLKEHSYISSFVTNLVLRNNKGEDRPRRLDLRHLHEVVSLLPALVSIKIIDLNLDVEDVHKEHRLTDTIHCAPLPHIRALLLVGVGATPVDITYLLWLVSSIGTLRITDSEVREEQSSCHSPPVVDLASLRHVKLSHSHLSSGFIQQLSKTAPNLCSLCLTGRDPEAPDVSRTLMFPSSLTLRRLCLDLKNVASDNDQHPMNVPNHLDLKSFYNLEELKLTVEMARTDDEGHDPGLQIQWTLLLGLVESSEASRIIISLSPPRFGMESFSDPSVKLLECPLLDDWWTSLKGQAWPILDGCLASKASIPELGFMGETFCDFDPFYSKEYLGNKLEENIRSSLPRMSSLGMVVFWNEDKDSETWWSS
ncbi:hypothetical protein NLI96_g1857 [Meripilus lineatus]|uniref:Uncharacterized protein n=1 Tax=Meripilus lineatus TaxID=2056292 RepID=A0AAD5V9E8_9APHY|nr:hypothetical protein NLI96_g1857 [Physisporinus lineatus]